MELHGKNVRFRCYSHIVFKEELIREMVVYCFQKKACPLREFIDDMINVAEFLRYSATE